MDKCLQPTRFDCDPNTVGVDKQWKHWLKTFENFLVAINSCTPDKPVTLTNYIAPNVYEYIVGCATYEEAMEVKYVQSTLSHLMTTSVPRAMFTPFLVEHGLSQYYLY